MPAPIFAVWRASAALMPAIAIALPASCEARTGQAMQTERLHQRSLSPEFVRDLCAAVSEQTVEIEPTHDEIVYRYQQHIARAAGVVPSDSAAEFAVKMSRWLNAEMPQLLCNQFNFNPSGGNILKLAVARSADPFIGDAIDSWHVDLNQIDKVDGMTVLDYISLRRDEAGTNANLIRIYDQYYRHFRAAGAMHARELQR